MTVTSAVTSFATVFMVVYLSLGLWVSTEAWRSVSTDTFARWAFDRLEPPQKLFVMISFVVIVTTTWLPVGIYRGFTNRMKR